MSKPVKRRCPQCGNVQSSTMLQSSKRPSKVKALAELLRVTEETGTAQTSRDYFRANSRIGDQWSLHWPSFRSFLAAASADDDLYYDALVELVAGR